MAKTARDIFVGVDVWGRGSHGGGGFGAYKAIEHVAAVGSAMGIAFFGQGWTWESIENEPWWTWEHWWNRERTLWVGPANPKEHVEVPEAPRRPNEPHCPHGPFKPMSKFYPPCPPPDPLLFPFWTSFCPGVGFKWFVAGVEVSAKNPVWKETKNAKGWTDVSKQTSLGNQLWPRPMLSWDTDTLSTDLRLPHASTSLLFDDAYNGGSSVKITIELQAPPKDRIDDAQFRSVRIAVQGLCVTPGVSYDATLIYKIDGESEESGVDVNVGLSIKNKTSAGTVVDVVTRPGPDQHDDERLNGWSRTSVRFTADAKDPAEGTLISIGTVLGMFTEDASKSYNIQLRLGQLSVLPAPVERVEPALTRILWASAETTRDNNADAATSNQLSLTWEFASSFDSPPRFTPTNRDDPNPPWILDHTLSSLPRFAYFNVYVLAIKAGVASKPEEAIFVGTTGWHGHRNALTLYRDVLPEEVKKGPIRVYVQGVLEGGVVLPWSRCAFVEVK